jgi:hypothetical protein
MCVDGTPVDDYLGQYGLLVKREDLCCPPGPHFSKCRGVYPHAAGRPEGLIGVLDTSHSQGGWAVAQACALLGKQCRLFYPVYRGHEFDTLRPQQQEAAALGAELVGLPAGRSAVLYHRAKQTVEAHGGYMFPNALKLPETVEETARELVATRERRPNLPFVLLVSASSGTIAAGLARVWPWTLVVHMGYDRPPDAVRKYMEKMSGVTRATVHIFDEGYAYKDVARPGPTPPWPCNSHYDLKAFRWWLAEGRRRYGEALFWNIG